MNRIKMLTVSQSSVNMVSVAYRMHYIANTFVAVPAVWSKRRPLRD